MTTLVDLQNEAGKNSTRAFTARPSGAPPSVPQNLVDRISQVSPLVAPIELLELKQTEAALCLYFNEPLCRSHILTVNERRTKHSIKDGVRSIR